MKILFSLLGFTDPIRNNYDGPMLHMVRHLRPDTVYLFMTREIVERDQKDNRFVKAIQSIDSSIHVEKIDTDIADPHLHNASSEILKNVFHEVCRKHDGEEIFVNISSGTPQLITVLNLLIVTTPHPVKPYQVTTPENRGNRTPTTSDAYDIDLEIECNLDGDENETTEKRLHHADLMQYKQTLVYGQIEALIEKQYDYKGVLTLLKKSGVHTSEKLFNLLTHGQLRLDLRTEEALKRLNKDKMREAFPVRENERIRELVEYYQIVKVQQKTGELANMVLMLDPFAIRLQEAYMKTILKVDPNRFITKHGRKKLLSGKKIAKFDEKLKSTLDKKFKGFQDAEPSVVVYHYMLEYFLQKQNRKDDGFFCLSKKLTTLKTDLRNPLAHELRTTTDAEINQTIGVYSQRLLENIEDILTSVLTIKKKHLEVYERLNTAIVDLLRQSK